MVLSDKEREIFPLLEKQRALLSPASNPSPSYLPYTTFEKVENISSIDLGQKEIAQGKVATLVVAGGQGSRLGFLGPKGAYPFELEGKKTTLFQLLAENILKASRQASIPLPIALMTSPDNDRKTRDFFLENNFFGLQKDQIDFFTQSTLPLLDKEGHLLERPKGTPLLAPCGNGTAFFDLNEADILEKWGQQGVKWIQFIPIDNPLAAPFDPFLSTYHLQKKSDCVIKAIPRTDPKEKVGLLVTSNSHPKVVEYSEISEKEQLATTSSGNLYHPLANISLFSFSFEFITRIVTQKKEGLPLHKAFKKIIPQKCSGWKFEFFIFDLLEDADTIECLVYPRNKTFSPLKEASDIPKMTHDLKMQGLI